MSRGPRGQGTIKQKSNGRWEGQVSLGKDPITGKRIRKSFSAATREEVELKMSQWHQPSEEVTVADAFNVRDQQLAHANVSQSTKDTWLYARKRCHNIEELPVNTLDVDWAQAWTNTLQGSLSTQRKTWQYVRSALPHLFTGVAAPTVTETEAPAATSEQVDGLLAATVNPWKTLFTIMAYTGMRPGEVRTLRWEHYDVAGETLSVTRDRAKNPSSVRAVPVIEVVAEALAEYRQTTSGSGYMFPNQKGDPVDRWRVNEAFKRAGECVAGLTPHSLRHGAATRMLSAGVPVHEVAAVLGHSSPTVTLQVYAHSVQKARKTALNTLQVS